MAFVEKKENGCTLDVQLLKETLREIGGLTRSSDACLKNLSNRSSMIVVFWSQVGEFCAEVFFQPFVGIEFDSLGPFLMIFQKQETRGTMKWSLERWRLSTCSKDVTNTSSTRRKLF